MTTTITTRVQTAQLTNGEAQAEVLAHTPGVEFPFAYPGSTERGWAAKCPEGHDISIRVAALRARPERGICDHSDCGGKRRLTDDEARARISAKYPEIEFLDSYHGANERWAVRCPVHGDTTTSYSTLMHTDTHYCHDCSSDPNAKAVFYSFGGVLNGRAIYKVGVSRNWRSRRCQHRTILGHIIKADIVFPITQNMAYKIEAAAIACMTEMGMTFCGDNAPDGYKSEAVYVDHLTARQRWELQDRIERVVIESVGIDTYAQHLYADAA